jgi:hypothetical protein
MDNLDKYAEQLRRQNLGYTCQYCDSAAGHRVSCLLLSTPPRVITGPDFNEQKYQPLNPVETIEQAVDAVNKYYRKGSPRKVEVVPNEGDHIMLRGAYISWEGDNR